jgi:copper transport protein
MLSCAVFAAGVLAPAAFAHATVVATSPRDGAIVGTPPTEVRIRFDDPVVVGPGNAVVANDGGSVLVGRPHLAAGNRELVLPLRRLSNGDYSVRWRIISDDGHLEDGVLAFRVGSGTASGTLRSVFEAESTRPSVVDVVSRWLYLGGILVAGGTALFLLFVSRAARRRAPATLALSLVAVLAGGLWLLHATHGGATRFGHVTEVALLVAAPGAVAATLAGRYPRLLVVAVAASLALLFAPSLAGHALDAGRSRALAFTADVVHIAAAAFWIGGLLQLALLLRDGQPVAARRFSRLALPAVVLLAFAGGVRAFTELSAVSQLWSTGYGRAIVVKSALFLTVLGLAWVSRNSLASAARLLGSVSAELAVLVVLVGVVAVLTALRPGRDAVAAPAPIGTREVGAPVAPPSGSVVYARESRELAVALAVRPGRPLRLTATIVGQSGNGVDGLDVELIAAAGNHGASRAAQSCGHGCYTATLPLAAPTQFAVNIAGAGAFRSIAFPIVGSWPPPPGKVFLARATRAYRALRSALFSERLASAPGRSITTTWKLEAPDRLEYSIKGGAGGIVIGRTRWDRPTPGARWTRSTTLLLPQPRPPWGPRIENARMLRATPRRVTLSWLDPGVPAWFTATFNRRSALPVELHMTAAAHFMLHRPLAFNRDLQIRPPR